MDAATKLATIFVKAAHTKRADPLPLPELRTQFEDSAAKEQLLRRHALRLEELARRRSAAEDKSLGGYVDTAAARLTPVPHTSGEALTRLPAVAAGGIGGYLLGKGMEPFDSKELLRVLAPAGKGKPGSSPLAQNLAQVTNEGMDANNLIAGLRKENPSDVARAMAQNPNIETRGRELLGKAINRPIPQNENVQKIRAVLDQTLKGGAKTFRREVENVATQTGKPGVVKSLLQRMGKYRVGGALAGAGAASILTGLPYMLRALWQKHQGGEAAVRARGEMNNFLGQAQQEQTNRDDLLKQLPAKPVAAPATGE